MKSFFLALPPMMLVAACGGPTADQTMTTTNTGNVIPNESLANYSFENDAIPNTAAEDAAAMNAMDGNESLSNGM